MKVNTEVLTNYLNKQCDEKTKLMVEDWINKSPQNKNYFKELELYWNAEGKGIEQPSFDAEKAFERVKERSIIRMKQFRRRILRYASIACLLISTSVTYFLLQPSDISKISNNEIKEKRISLPDGSYILLAKGSTVEYSENFSGKERLVHLSGEAFFKVAKNKSKPFIINTEHTRTTVLGTSFRIKEARTKTSINVESGIVSFTDVNNTENQIVLQKGDVAEFIDKQKVLFKVSNSKVNDIAIIKYLEYSDEKLSKICNDLKEIFNEDIIFADERLSQLTMSAVFENQNLNSILESICFTLDLEIEKKGKSILIKLDK